MQKEDWRIISLSVRLLQCETMRIEPIYTLEMKFTAMCMHVCTQQHVCAMCVCVCTVMQHEANKKCAEKREYREYIEALK